MILTSLLQCHHRLEQMDWTIECECEKREWGRGEWERGREEGEREREREREREGVVERLREGGIERINSHTRVTVKNPLLVCGTFWFQ